MISQVESSCGGACTGWADSMSRRRMPSTLYFSLCFSISALKPGISSSPSWNCLRNCSFTTREPHGSNVVTLKLSRAFSRKLLSAVVLFNSLTTGSKSGNGPMEIDFARHFSYVVVMILCSNCSPFLPLSPGTMVPHKVFGPGRASKVLRWGVQQHQYC